MFGYVLGPLVDISGSRGDWRPQGVLWQLACSWLAPLVSCLVRGVPGLGQIGSWSGVCPGANKLEGGFQNGSCQHQVLPKFLSNYCFCLEFRVCEILCALLKNGAFISYSPLALLRVIPNGLKGKHSRELAFTVQPPPRLGITMWLSDPLLIGENLYNCDYPPLCGSPNWEHVS